MVETHGKAVARVPGSCREAKGRAGFGYIGDCMVEPLAHGVSAYHVDLGWTNDGPGECWDACDTPARGGESEVRDGLELSADVVGVCGQTEKGCPKVLGWRKKWGCGGMLGFTQMGRWCWVNVAFDCMKWLIQEPWSSGSQVLSAILANLSGLMSGFRGSWGI